MQSEHLTMFLRSIVAVALLTMLHAGTAFASVDRLDNAPGATLLLPRFIVDPGDIDNSATNTRFTVGNVSDSSKVARVTLWTDLGVSTLAFNIHLNGHDEVEIDLRQLFGSGRVPESGVGVGPAGDLAQTEQAAPGCDAIIGGEIISDAEVRSRLISAHRGFVGPDAQSCGGLPFGDSLVRGYATVDVVNECQSAGISQSWNGTAVTPETAGYFVAGGNGIAANDNVLFGRFSTVESDGGFGGELVSLQADASDTRTSTLGGYTFYGSFVNFDASDNREPLGGIWQARMLSAGAFETELVAWRDPKQVTLPFTCGAVPSWFPLSQTELAWADEEEQFFFFGDDIVFPNIPPPRPLIFPAVSGVANPAEFSPFQFGFVQLNLSTTIFGQAALSVPDVQQSWVGIRLKEPAGDPNRGFSDLRPATMLIPLWQLADSLSCSSPCTPPATCPSSCAPFEPLVQF